MKPNRAQKKKGTLSRRERLFFYLFIAHALIGFVLLTAFPFFMSLCQSFTNMSLLYPADAKFKPDNYLYLLTKHPKFWGALLNSFLYALFNVILTNIIAILVSVLLTKRKVYGERIFRALYYIPSILPALATTIMFTSIFDPSNGLINNFLLLLGIPRHKLPLWLSDSGSALGTLILMSCWGFGGKMIICIAGVNGIPKTYYEAAALDGSTPVSCFFRITLPLLTPAILYNVIVSVIGGMQVFTEAFVGAGSAIDFYVGMIYNTAYTGTYQMGLASAMAWILCIIVFCLVMINMKFSKRFVNYDY